ncbi:Mur ligase family protein [Thermomicrobium sp. CFH 73360]|uniref:bifunctional folylpolyglutamate synthase/dihydrofolate synthase n=1 Tax=Thermomicrobium sp. CFH 73360 TaxID=2951987 RepID=UPI00207739BB|nr:cyanophycin synthetase [Thermomicrobium sp. CFH 73360]MCM8747399.1 Mur ligase family protein [Thermomicrobium sp. CFH 73360]
MHDLTFLDARYRWAVSYLRALIQAPPGPPPGTLPEVVRLRAQRRLERLRAFLSFLNDPHRSYPVIHVTGTSGKGSTAAFIASILDSAGYRVGLHVSPYLQVETEKLQIGRRLIAAERFADLVAELDEAVRSWVARGGQPLTYGEFWTALVFNAFRAERVDIAVVEVGVGGRFDLTNVVQPEVSVITTVGLDHLRTLGPTIRDIAWHKAGIIKPGRPAITGVTEPELLGVLQAEATTVGAPLRVLLRGRDFDHVLEEGRSYLVDRLHQRKYELGLDGDFQALNAALAVAAVRALSPELAAHLSDEAIAHGLATARFPGRFEIVQRAPIVVLDGAHNPQKLEALLTALDRLPQPGRRIVIFGVLDGHDAPAMAARLARQVDIAITTAPRAILREAADPDSLSAIFASYGCTALTIPDVDSAIETALALAKPEDQVLVTGSLYLVGQVREHWYPAADIVTQQTCWPKRAQRTATEAEAACRQ